MFYIHTLVFHFLQIKTIPSFPSLSIYVPVLTCCSIHTRIEKSCKGGGSRQMSTCNAQGLISHSGFAGGWLHPSYHLDDATLGDSRKAVSEKQRTLHNPTLPSTSTPTQPLVQLTGSHACMVNKHGAALCEVSPTGHGYQEPRSASVPLHLHMSRFHWGSDAVSRQRAVGHAVHCRALFTHPPPPPPIPTFCSQHLTEAELENCQEDFECCSLMKTPHDAQSLKSWMMTRRHSFWEPFGCCSDALRQLPHCVLACFHFTSSSSL